MSGVGLECHAIFACIHSQSLIPFVANEHLQTQMQSIQQKAKEAEEKANEMKKWLERTNKDLSDAASDELKVFA